VRFKIKQLKVRWRGSSPEVGQCKGGKAHPVKYFTTHTCLFNCCQNGQVTELDAAVEQKCLFVDSFVSIIVLSFMVKATDSFVVVYLTSVGRNLSCEKIVPIKVVCTKSGFTTKYVMLCLSS